MCYLFVRLIKTIFVLCWSCWTTTSANFENCWTDALVVQLTSVSSPPNVTIVRDETEGWNLLATLSWEAPEGFLPNDSYVVAARNLDGLPEPDLTDFCSIRDYETRTNDTYFIFNYLDFGFLYEFEIFTYRPTRGKAVTPTTVAFMTRDCFQATGDVEFCSEQEVQHSGAPTNLALDHVCLNETSSFLEVTISWEPPIQVNGFLSFFEVKISTELDDGMQPPSSSNATLDGNQYSEFIELPKSYNVSLGGRISTNITNLERNQVYFVTIIPYVASVGLPPDFNPGIEVEMRFLTELDFLKSEKLTKADTFIPCVMESHSTTTIAPSSGPIKNTLSVKNNGFTPTKTKAKANKNNDVQKKHKPPQNVHHSFTNGSEPMTLPSILLVVGATILVTILIVAILILGVHYMRGVPADHSQTKLSFKNSKQPNGEVVVEDIAYGAPLRENV